MSWYRKGGESANSIISCHIFTEYNVRRNIDLLTKSQLIYKSGKVRVKQLTNH